MRNLINLLHSVFASILSTNYIIKPAYKTKQIIYFTSQTYFLHDLYRIRKGDYLDIIHHIISSIGLLCFYIGYYDNIIIELYHYGEISNVAIFGHYLVIKNVTDKRILLVSSSLEFVIYTYYRVLCMTQLIFDNYEIFFQTPLSSFMIIYFMSIDWSYTLFNKLCDDIKDVIR